MTGEAFGGGTPERPSKRHRSRPYTLVAALLACGVMPLASQTWPFPWPEDRIARYTARRVSSQIVIDGQLEYFESRPWRWATTKGAAIRHGDWIANACFGQPIIGKRVFDAPVEEAHR